MENLILKGFVSELEKVSVSSDEKDPGGPLAAAIGAAIGGLVGSIREIPLYDKLGTKGRIGSRIGLSALGALSAYYGLRALKKMDKKDLLSKLTEMVP